MFEALLSRIGEVQERATVKTVFGEPYQIDGRTIIPIARVAYGFGFGGGRANGSPPDAAEAASGTARREPGRRTAKAAAGEPAADSGAGGGGGGAGISVRPVAVLEISGAETKFRPIVDVTRLVIAGMLLGAWSVFWITYTARKTAAWR
jgi:uncharacterized spore protein YtfJ